MRKAFWRLAGPAVLAGLTAIVTGAAHASVQPTTIGQGSAPKSVCTRTSPEFRIHAGGTRAYVQLGTPKFTAYHLGSHFNGPYVTAGYMEGISTSYTCQGYGGHLQEVPVKLGKQGHIVASVHEVTSPDFGGDAGFDLWFTPNPASDTYAVMRNGGTSTTEAMIWLSRDPDLESWIRAATATVWIDGTRWYVVPQGLVGYHPGLTNGWNRVFFVRDNSHHGNITISHLPLDPFATWMIRHGYLKATDYWEAIDLGSELVSGSVSVAGYQLTGLPYHR